MKAFVCPTFVSQCGEARWVTRLAAFPHRSRGAPTRGRGVRAPIRAVTLSLLSSQPTEVHPPLNPMSAYVRWLVAQKREWHHPSAPDEQALGFRGWHTRGYLPHFDVAGTTQMVGFRLADSLPQARRREWEAILRIKDKRERRVPLEDYLDLGHGTCELAIPTVAQRMEEILLYDDNRGCRLLALGHHAQPRSSAGRDRSHADEQAGAMLEETGG